MLENRPNITPSQHGNNHAAGHRLPTREQLAAATAGFLKVGGPHKADLRIVDLGDGPFVVKDFGGKRWPWSWLGRLQVARECRAYEWLRGDPGLPAFFGRIDAWALAMEKVDGEMLAFAETRFSEGERWIAALRLLVDRLHDAGVFHQDLRGRENVLLRPDGRLVLLDLAGSICLRPGGIAHRWLRPLLRVSDESAFLKWKALLTPDRFTPEEERFLKRFRFWRSLWIFNRKRPAPGGSGS